MGTKRTITILISMIMMLVIMIPAVISQSDIIGFELPPETYKNAARTQGMHPTLFSDTITTAVQGSSIISIEDPSLLFHSTAPLGGSWLISTSGNNLQFKRGVSPTSFIINGATGNVNILGGLSIGGNVGIGTTTPITKLNIAGTGWDGFLSLSDTNSGAVTRISLAANGLLFRNYLAGGTGSTVLFSFRNASDSRLLDILKSGDIVSLGALRLGTVRGTPTSGMIQYSGGQVQVFTGASWVNISTSASGGGSSVWTPHAQGIYYGDGKPVYVHAGGAQVIASNMYYSGVGNATQWYRFKNGSASGIGFSDSGINIFAMPIGTAGVEISSYNVGLTVPPSGGLLLPSITGANPPTGTLRMQGDILQVYTSSGNWTEVNNNPVVPQSEWVSCEGGTKLCYMGTTTGGSTISRYPSSNIFAGEWIRSSGCVLEYDCIRDNTSYLETGANGNTRKGEYNLADFNIPVGNIIEEVKLEFECRNVGNMVHPGYLYMYLMKGSLPEKYQIKQVHSTSWWWYSAVFANSFDGSSWDANDLNGIAIRIQGKAPYTVSGGGGGSSFVANSLILMTDGSLKPIEDVIVGDKVVSYDIYTNENVVREVIQTMKGFKKYLTLNNELRLSADHLVYVEGKGYVEAGDLEIGDKLIKSDGSTTKVYSISELSDAEVYVYDFTVDEPSNFFADGYLVHNEDPLPLTYIYGSLQCRRARATVSYAASSESKVTIDSLSGGTTIRGQVSAPVYSGTSVSAASVSSDTVTGGTLTMNKICLNGQCITDFSQLAAPPTPTCQWINPTSAFPPGGYYARRMNVQEMADYVLPGQCRATCARQNPYCPAILGQQLVGTANFPLSHNPYLCDDTANCVEDTNVPPLCSSGYTKIMPMKIVTISTSPLGLEICI